MFEKTTQEVQTACQVHVRPSAHLKNGAVAGRTRALCNTALLPLTGPLKFFQGLPWERSYSRTSCAYLAILGPQVMELARQ